MRPIMGPPQYAPAPAYGDLCTYFPDSYLHYNVG